MVVMATILPVKELLEVLVVIVLQVVLVEERNLLEGLLVHIQTVMVLLELSVMFLDQIKYLK
jgi:hypothetical protein